MHSSQSMPVSQWLPKSKEDAKTSTNFATWYNDVNPMLTHNEYVVSMLTSSNGDVIGLVSPITCGILQLFAKKLF